MTIDTSKNNHLSLSLIVYTTHQMKANGQLVMLG